jgi:hypothetical protein
MRPVVSFLRARGHRLFSYLNDFFGAAATARNDHPVTEADTRRVERDVHELFSRLGLTLHPTKSHFEGSRAPEILGILVDTRRARYLLSPEKLLKVYSAVRVLLSHSSRNRRHVPVRSLRSFAGLGFTWLVVIDARLRLRGLFDALSACTRPTRSENFEPAAPPEASTAGPKGLDGSATARAHRRSLQPRLSHAAMQDLLWWSSRAAKCTSGSKYGPRQASLCSQMQACAVGALFGTVRFRLRASSMPRTRAPASTSWSFSPPSTVFEHSRDSRVPANWSSSATDS